MSDKTIVSMTDNDGNPFPPGTVLKKGDQLSVSVVPTTPKPGFYDPSMYYEKSLYEILEELNRVFSESAFGRWLMTERFSL